MSDRPTPETNAFGGNLGDWIKFAEKLERERDEAREDLEFRRGLYKVQEERLEKVIKELAEAREALDRK